MQGTQNGAESGYIEFVARPTRYNNVNVATKDAASSSQDEIEDVIYNLYFLLFENSTNDGRLIYFEELDPSAPNASLKADKGLTGAYACFLANVTEDFAKSITTVGGLKSAIYEIQEYATSNGRLGVPVIEIDGEDTPCLPMFGVSANSINMSASGTAEIALRRLFAKVILNLNVAIPDDNTSTFTLDKVSLTNLPDRVALTTPAGESAWTASTSTYFVDPVSLDQIDGAIVSNGSGYQMVCYVPEYKVTAEKNASQVEGYNAEYDAQFYKPLLCPNKRPAYITIEGSMGNNIYVYKIYLGEDNHSNFNMLRNTQYTNNVTITGTSSKDVDHRVTYTTMPTMLVNGEAANCYIISMPGKYQLDTYQGVCKNLSNVTPLKGYPFIVANDGNVSLSLWNSGTFDDKIIMDVGNNGTLGQYISTLTSGGNAVVGLNSKSDATGEWLWTWHLWFSVELSGEVLGYQITLLNVSTQTYPSTKQLMDRNLGSCPSTVQIGTPGATSGLYYKYGHRAPLFTDTEYNKGTDYHGFSDDDDTTWQVTDESGNVIESKSMMDPCPAGYRVPTSSVFSGDATKEHAGFKIGDFDLEAFRFWNNETSIYLLDDIYFPYSGYLNASKSPVSSPSVSLTKSAGDYTYEIPNLNEWSDVKITYRGYSFTLSFPVTKTVRDVSFAVSATAEFGEMWASNGSISYGSASASLLSGNTTISQYTLVTTKVKSVTAKGLKWEGWTPTLDYDIDEYEETPQYNTGMTDTQKGLMLADYLVRGGTVSLADVQTNSSIRTDSRGCQVRCVVDTQQ